MSRSKQLMTVIGALTCAAGIGFVMQNSESARVHYGDDKTRIHQDVLPEVKGASAGNAVLDVQEITLTSAEFDPQAVLPDAAAEVTALSATTDAMPEPELPLAAEIEPACEIVANARPMAAAMVELTLNAMCLPNERVTVHHNGMLFTETTSATGDLLLKIPALAQDSVFILAFPSGEGAVAQTTVADIGQYERVVLQWKGDIGFEIHAREFGADYGAAGHVWNNVPGDIAAAVSGAGGVLTRHGDSDAADPLIAEVYTFPKQTDRSGSVALSVEAEVTADNCGLEIEAQSLEMQPDNSIRTQNLILPVPDCEATGNFLVLNNLLQDLKVAGK